MSGLIPYPTYYLTETDVQTLLIPYGQNITGYFRRDKDGIRTGGYNFTMDLRPGLTLPKTLTIHNETINVINKDDKRHCTYCDRHGHTRQYCRQRQQQDNTENHRHNLTFRTTITTNTSRHTKPNPNRSRHDSDGREY